MNLAQKARNVLKLTPEEFALLLGVSESAVHIEEIRGNGSASITDGLYTLILLDRSRCAQILLEERLKNAPRFEHVRLNALTVKLHDLQIV